MKNTLPHIEALQTSSRELYTFLRYSMPYNGVYKDGGYNEQEKLDELLGILSWRRSRAATAL